MEKKDIRIIILNIILLLTLSMCSQKDVVASELDDLRNKVEVADQELSIIQSNLSNLNNTIINHTLSLESTNEELARVSKDIEEKQSELDKAKEEITSITNEMELVYENAGKQARTIQTSSVNNYLVFILNSDDFNDLVKRFNSISKLMAANEQSLRELEKNKKEYEELIKFLEKQEKKLLTKQSSFETIKQKQIDEETILNKEVEEYNTKLVESKLKAESLMKDLELLNSQLSANEAIRLNSYIASISNVNLSEAELSLLTSNKNLSSNQQLLLKGFIAKIGIPYVWGGESMAEGGYDCSGLMQAVYAEIGINIPRVSQDQQNVGIEVDKNNLAVGDLIFFGRPATHVAVYIGNNLYIEAPEPGKTIQYNTYNPTRVTNARRILPLNQVGM
jgi:peptidoglycan hydrolase CwlO-like protein